MKAYVLHGINDLRLEKVKTPKPGDHEVLVKVQAAGICGSDIPRIFRNGTYSFPLIPGHEFAGEVCELGELVDERWQGKRVGVFPLIPCHNCVPCQKHQYEMCRSYRYLGSRTNGGFAEFVIVPENNLLELPEEVSMEQAAMLEPMAVAIHAMRNAKICPEQLVAICGLGTIGLLLCMFLIEAGVNNIFVIGNKEFQKECALKLGIPEENYCDGRTTDVDAWIAERTQRRGIDIFFECVGKNTTISQAICNAAPGGTVQLVGNPATDIQFEKNVYWKILRNQLTVLGTWNSSFLREETDDWHYAIERLVEGKVHPEMFITQKLAFQELETGLHIMRDKTKDYVKIMIC